MPIVEKLCKRENGQWECGLEEDIKEAKKAINMIGAAKDLFYKALKEHNYVPQSFKEATIEEEIYFKRFFEVEVNDENLELVTQGKIAPDAILGSGGCGDGECMSFNINWCAFSNLADNNEAQHALFVAFHELIHLEEARKIKPPAKSSVDGTIFYESLTNLKAKRLLEKVCGDNILPRTEQIDCGYMTNIGTINYQIPTQLVDNLITAMDLDIDELIKDGINNKENHRANIIGHFKNAGTSFIADISPPLEKMYQLIYDSRKRDLTQIEKQRIGKIIDKIQKTTKDIYTHKHPNATREEKQAFTQNFIDTSKTYTQTKFLCELCGIEPEQKNIDKGNVKDYC